MVSPDSTAEFGLAYDGPALTENTMDVRDLAPSLLALGELFTRANELLNRESVSVSLKVRATRPGSFEILLVLTQAYQTATQFLTPEMVTTAISLKSLLIGNVGLFDVIKRLRGRTAVVAAERPDAVVLTVDNLSLEIPTEVFRLYRDSTAKRLLAAVAGPLLRQGIERIVFKEGDNEVESITKEDAPSFTAAVTVTADDGVLTQNTSTVALKLISPNFDTKKSKWRFHDGDAVKWYGLADENFIQEVRHNERRFGAGDYLLCTVEIVQRAKGDGGIEVERTISRVIEQHNAGEQLKLPQ